MTWFDLVLLSLVVYRVTRFFSLDSLIEEPRKAIVGWLLSKDNYVEDGEEWPMSYWRRKAKQWIECPYCQSVWYAMATYLVWREWGDTTPIQVLYYWLALAGAAMIVYRYTDPAPPCVPTKKCE